MRWLALCALAVAGCKGSSKPKPVVQAPLIDSSIPDASVGPPEVVVLVDNRGGPVRTLKVGERQREVPAGQLARFEFPLTPGAAVTLDGAPVETLPMRGRAPDSGWSNPYSVLIDPTAARCYQWKRATYSSLGFGNSLERELVRQISHYIGGAPTEQFGEPLPESIMVKGYGSSDRRASLAEVPCANLVQSSDLRGRHAILPCRRDSDCALDVGDDCDPAPPCRARLPAPGYPKTLKTLAKQRKNEPKAGCSIDAPEYSCPPQPYLAARAVCGKLAELNSCLAAPATAPAQK